MSDFFASQTFAVNGTFSTLCPGGIAAPGASVNLVTTCLNASATGVRLSLLGASFTFFGAAICFLLASREMRINRD